MFSLSRDDYCSFPLPQLALGHLHYHGSHQRGVAQNLAQAAKYFRAAAEAGDASAAGSIGHM